MNQRDMAAFKSAEREYLTEPEDDFEPKRCERCEEIPDDEKLYKYYGEWYCLDCLAYDVLESRNAYNRREWE